jgi:hypothetical protein
MHPTTDIPYRASRAVAALLTITPCRKVYVAGRLRVHHGLVGEAAILAAVLPGALVVRATLVAFGAGLIWHDRHDWPFPIRDRI